MKKVSEQSNKIKRVLLPTSILIAGITLMIAGIWRSELDEIFHRGIMICLECIGIG